MRLFRIHVAAAALALLVAAPASFALPITWTFSGNAVKSVWPQPPAAITIDGAFTYDSDAITGAGTETIVLSALADATTSFAYGQLFPWSSVGVPLTLVDGVPRSITANSSLGGAPASLAIDFATGTLDERVSPFRFVPPSTVLSSSIVLSVPEPATAFLLGIGLALLTRARDDARRTG